MWRGFQLIFDNVKMQAETVLLLILSIGCLVFAAKDLRLGLLMLFITSGGLFIWFYSQSMTWAPSLVVMLMSLVGMVFTLYSSQTFGRGAT